MDAYTSLRHIDLTYSRKKPTRKEYHEEYNKKYREEHSNTIHCACGGSFKETSEYAHKKTKRHLAYGKSSRLTPREVGETSP